MKVSRVKEREGILVVQINLIEQQVKKLQRFMNDEMDSLLSQLQHLRELEVMKEVPLQREPRKVKLNSWEHIPDVLRVKDIQTILGIGNMQAYALAKSGEFHYIHIGNRILVPKPGFIDWLEGKE